MGGKERNRQRRLKGALVKKTQTNNNSSKNKLCQVFTAILLQLIS